ncbi:MAG: glycosyltransferase family 4 protein [Bacteroidales bacterium]|nr:glycosyltransferase family 4 protein [Bacteroidales bacterium]
MNILVNTRLLLHGKLEGIGFYTHQLMQKVVRNHPEHTFYFLFDRPYHQEFIYADNVIPIVAGLPARHPFLYVLWFELTVPRIIKKYKIDLFFSPDHFLSLRARVPTLLAVHDLNFMHHPENLPLLTSIYYRYFFPKFVRKAHRIIAVSEYTQKDLYSYFNIPEYKVDVVYNAPNLPVCVLSHEQKVAIRQKYTGGKPYFFYLGSLHKRKNIGRMLLAFDAFLTEQKSDYYLVIGGRAMFSDKEMEKDYQKVVHKERIVFTGRLNDEEASKLMGGATALLFVSLFEGFGVPIVEAMQCGVPVITSNLTSMPEIADDAAVLVNPLSVQEIAQAMTQLVNDEPYRKRLIEKGFSRVQVFSWDNSAEKFWEAIEKMLK